MFLRMFNLKRVLKRSYYSSESIVKFSTEKLDMILYRAPKHPFEGHKFRITVHKNDCVGILYLKRTK